jgi:DNA-binding GntR family transcriptional regulator
MTANAFQRPPTAQQAVLAELRRAIIQGELPPGSQIVQDTLADKLGVSRVPIREALRILEGEGQVAYSPHRGYFIAELNLEELLEIQRLRALLEPEAVTKAIQVLTDADVQVMSTAFDEMEAAAAVGDIAGVNVAHTRFHFALLTPCGMPRLIRILQQLWAAADPYRAIYHGDEPSRLRAQSEHAQILDAARRRDQVRLVVLLAEHRQHTVDRLSGPLAKHAAVT